MRYFLGIDTSNYTTSAAVYDKDSGKVTQLKKLLPVKEGERGLRQSDAVFHHTVQLPALLEELFSYCPSPDCVAVSAMPERREGSYMPCFLVGEGAARSVAASKNIPIHRFSHQEGHIAAALYSAGKLELLGDKFFAFHVSGGTTQLILVTKSDSSLFNTTVLASSLDLKAGQVIDRVGVKLKLKFPAGQSLDEISLKSDKDYFTTMRCKLIGGNCSFSGLENQADKMLRNGERECDTARFVFESIACTLCEMVRCFAEKHGSLPLVLSGGVMSNTIIRQRIGSAFPSLFATPEFSCDNAVGVAVLSYLEEK
ncbi:MAG: peptidase M22 [Acutalibacteraceae bacterium]